MGREDKLIHVGHDLETETLNNIKKGSSNASLSQDPYTQGYKSVETLYNFIMKGIRPSNIDTGVLRVDEKNIDEFIEKLNNGEPIG